MNKYAYLILSLGLISGCATRTTPAPIVNATTAPDYLQSHSSKTVSTGNSSDTKLDSLNDDNVKTEPVKQVQQSGQPKQLVAQMPATSGTIWDIPTTGTVVHKFTTVSKGIDYSGKLGQNVNAINGGKVLYSGNGLKGYGNLIIIKHDNVYLSAYAHNHNNLVQVGDIVKRGQKIATMGRDNGKPILHLEVRQSGKPIDPLTLIK